jgi:magnesium-transporting ATPase (P-type)
LGSIKTSNRSKGAGQLMIATISVALAAGLASALMFVSITSGALISLLLVILAPLPLMVAGLGWGLVAAMVGSIAATIVIGALFEPSYGMAFGLTNTLPACWLSHLVLLARPHGTRAASGNEDEALEWYPVGRILLWIVLLASMITTISLLTMGADARSIQNTIRKGWTELLSSAGFSSSDATVDALVLITPIGTEIGAVLALTLNLWLAARSAATSGRLLRPWPDLNATALPSLTIGLLGIAIALCFLGGLPAILAQVLTAGLSIAYAMSGFAVLHTVTLAMKSRSVLLGATYALVAAFAWALLPVALLGLADAVFGLRQRYLRSRPPPLPGS